MHSARLATLALVTTLAACATDPISPAATGAANPSLGMAANAATALYTFTLDGDLNNLFTASGQAVQLSRSTKGPFQNLTIRGVQLTIGAPNTTGPTGDTTICKLRSTALPWAPDWNANEGVWVGDLGVDGTNYVKFNGARPADPSETVQFTVNVGTSQAKDGSGVWHLKYSNSTIVFGGTTTRPDLGHRRCVTFELVAAPTP
jgi:hypothetical protein